MQTSPISFGKIYRGEVRVKNIRTNEYEKMNFVEYEETSSDKNAILNFERRCKRENDYSNKLFDLSTHIKESYLDLTTSENDVVGFFVHFYGLEDKNGEVHCLAETGDMEVYNDTVNENVTSIKDPTALLYLTVSPSNFYYRYDRKYSGLGSQMVKSIVDIANKNESSYIWLKSANDDFWLNMPNFKPCNELSGTFYVSENEYEELSKKLDERV